MKLSGVLTSLSAHKSGSNNRGDWSIQVVTVKSGNVSTDVKIWNRPDMTSAKGKLIELDGVVDGKGKNKAGNEINVKEIRAGEGTIETFDRPVSSADGGPRGPLPASGVPTQTEYDGVLIHAAKVAYQALAQSGLQVSSPDAVAEIVKGYMVGYAKGDFKVVKSQPAPAAPQSSPGEFDPEDIPF